MPTVSIPIEEFLHMCREAEVDLNFAKCDLKEAEEALCDIEHYIEFGQADGKRMVKLYKLLKEARISRRHAKEQIELLMPIAEWCARNEQVIRELQGLLGKTRKIESMQANRAYAIRSHALDDITNLTHLTENGVG